MGYILVTATLVVTLGRLGDMLGRVKIYNLGFVVFTLASVALSLDPAKGEAGAIWLIVWRLVQAVGGSMLMANSAAILTDAFPAEQRGMALGVNQIVGMSGQFIGLVAGGLLAAWDWRAVFWINVPFGVFGTVWAYRRLRETSTPEPGRIDWWGNLTFALGLALILISITYGIQPYHGLHHGLGPARGHMGPDPGGRTARSVRPDREPGGRAHVQPGPVQDQSVRRRRYHLAASARWPGAACSSC